MMGLLAGTTLEYRRSKNFLHAEPDTTESAIDLQESLGILALLSLSPLFRICKLQILLAGGETDPVSGHHKSETYMDLYFSPRHRSSIQPVIYMENGLREVEEVRWGFKLP
jgi:hypothetical protein